MKTDISNLPFDVGDFIIIKSLQSNSEIYAGIVHELRSGKDGFFHVGFLREKRCIEFIASTIYNINDWIVI